MNALLRSTVLTLDASVPEFDARGYKLLHGRGFHDGEIACYLSHITCLKGFSCQLCRLRPDSGR